MKTRIELNREIAEVKVRLSQRENAEDRALLKRLIRQMLRAPK